MWVKRTERDSDPAAERGPAHPVAPLPRRTVQDANLRREHVLASLESGNGPRGWGWAPHSLFAGELFPLFLPVLRYPLREEKQRPG